MSINNSSSARGVLVPTVFTAEPGMVAAQAKPLSSETWSKVEAPAVLLVEGLWGGLRGGVGMGTSWLDGNVCC